MSFHLQLRRGTSEDLAAAKPDTFRDGELIFVTDTRQLRVGFAGSTHVVGQIVEVDGQLFERLEAPDRLLTLGVFRPLR